MIDPSIASHTFAQARKGRSGCLFCNPFEGMKILETENFRVLADTFPIELGHLMISTKEHWGCAGEVGPKLRGELAMVKDHVRRLVERIVGSAIFYEHGRAGCCLKLDPNGQKCEHFHLHCLPVNVSLHVVLAQRFEFRRLQHYSDIYEVFLEEGNYLYFEDAESNMHFYPAADEKVESHLLRTLICNELHQPHRADWELYTDPRPFVESHSLIVDLVGAEGQGVAQ